MSTASARIRAEVARRVDEAFVSTLMDKMIRRHSGRGLRACSCDFCQAKAKATHTLQWTHWYIRPAAKIGVREKLSFLSKEVL